MIPLLVLGVAVVFIFAIWPLIWWRIHRRYHTLHKAPFAYQIKQFWSEHPQCLCGRYMHYRYGYEGGDWECDHCRDMIRAAEKAEIEARWAHNRRLDEIDTEIDNALTTRKIP